MPIQAEIYTTGGIAIGTIAGSEHLREVLEGGSSLVVQSVTWHPLDQGGARPGGDVTLPPDDVYIATAESMDDLPVHAQWHDIALEVGPYRIKGQMPTMPGFDPGRALARPTGEFVQLRDVTIGLTSETEGGLTRAGALVNRYVVDRVEADLMLGFFFPGATMVMTRETPPAGAVAFPQTVGSPPAP